MFDIFIKRQKIVVDCFTENIHAHDAFPIQSANKFYPSWWKILPNTFPVESTTGVYLEQKTMKACYGLLNHYRHGFVLPLWSDLLLQTQADGLGNSYSYQYADMRSQIGVHPMDQMGKEFASLVHVKLVSPWRIREKSGIEFIYMEPTWNYPGDLLTMSTPPGTVEYKYQHTSSVNMFLEKGRKYKFSAGRPMAHLIPLTEKNVELRCHLVNPTDMDNDTRRVMHHGFPFFQDGYLQKKKHQKALEEKSKCPFSFRKNK
jgi:hypothetical protein